ncbi:MAG TPA: cation diffusion facilitator family transporter [Aggregatilineales bacterium]|nr:cation diffusion facilitator family transporter [Aggregatilineales bacterium]
MARASLVRYAWLSIGAAVVTIGLKTGAYWLTGSVGLLSDALESGVNLIAALVALGALVIAARPPDDQHNFGHDKAEYFSSGVEGALILVAAFSIAYTSIERLLNPQPLDQIGIGLVVSVAASLVNLLVARILLRAGKEHTSIVLEADAHHLMTDVWTSIGVVVGVAAVGLTGWLWLDGVIALLVAANIVNSGVRLLRRSALGLLDSTIDAADLQTVTTVLTQYADKGIRWHGIRSRQSGSRQFITLHILVPGDWTVQAGHDLLEALEKDIKRQLPYAVVITHLEPQGDPAAEADQAIGL